VSEGILDRCGIGVFEEPGDAFRDRDLLRGPFEPEDADGWKLGELRPKRSMGLSDDLVGSVAVAREGGGE